MSRITLLLALALAFGLERASPSQTVAPQIVRITPRSPFTLAVRFSDPVDIAGATFSISGGVSVQGVSKPLADLVLLTTSRIPEDSLLTLTPAGVKDLAGLEVESGKNFRLLFLAGFALDEFYDEITGTTTATLINAPVYPNSPTQSQILTAFEGPTARADNYGSRISGWFSPPATGQYKFAIASDDSSSLFLSTDEAPVQKALIAWEPQWNGTRAWNTTDRRPNHENISAAKSLVAGQRYYIEIIHKEGDQDDHVGATYFPATAAIPADGTTELTGSVIGLYLDAENGFGPNPPNITTQPQDTAVAFGQAASLTIQASGTGLTYQWRRNGTNLPNQTAATLTISSAQSADAGNYLVAVANSTGIAVSKTAILNVEVCAPAPSGLVAWWRAEGNGVDSVRNVTATPLGGVSYVAGKSGQAFRNGALLVPNAPELRPSELTLAAWVKGPASGAAYIISKPAIGDGSSYRLYLLRDDTLIFECLGFPAGSANFQRYQVEVPWPSLEADRWRHVAATCDRTNFRVFFDGELAKEVNFPPMTILYDTFIGQGDLTIGTAYLGAPNFMTWTGSLDEVVLFNRALDETEIASIYNAGAASLCPPPTVTQQPVAQTVVAGSPAQFSATATTDSTLRYQWQFNRADLPGETNQTLNISSVSSTNAGMYRVVISSENGSVISAEVRLTVETCTPAPSGLVAWWRGEIDGVDSIGDQDGTLIGATAGDPALVGRGFTLDGIDDYVLMPSQPLPAIDQEITVSAWVKWLGGDGGTIISKYDSRIDSKNWCLLILSGGKVRFTLGDASGLVGHHGDTVDAVMSTGVWTHVMGTFTTTGQQLAVWVDGVSKALDRSPLTPPISHIANEARPAMIGVFRTTNLDSFFKGQIDEVMIFNRALNEADIISIYNAGAAGFCTPTIIQQPIAQTVVAGSSAQFSVTTATDAALRYQWQFNGANLVGQTNQTLNLAAVTAANAGLFRVIVSDVNGSAMSQEVRLIVDVCAPASNNLVAWWPGEGNANDFIGGNNGESRNGLQFASGRVGSAFSFDGVDDYVELPLIDLNGRNAITIGAWINPSSITANRHYTIIRQDKDANPDWLIHFRDYGTALEFGLKVEGVFSTVSIPIVSTQFVDGNWHYIAATYDGSTKRVYLDGAQIGSSPQTGNITTTGLRHTIGVWDGSVFFFHGLIDDVVIFDRALNAMEITSIYSAGAAGLCHTPIITQQPLPQGVLNGLSAQFRVAAAAASTLHYQWQFNGADLPGQTNQTLNIPAVSTVNAGAYRVIVFNGNSSVISQDAGLTVATCASTPNGFFRWWPGEGNANDLIVGSIGELRNGVQFAPGRVGSAFSFDGIDDYVEIPLINYNGRNAITIGTWIKPSSITANRHYQIIRQDMGANPDWLFAFQEYGTILSFGLKIAGAYTELDVPIVSTQFVDGNWHYVAATYDGSIKRVYLDGAQIGSTPQTGNITTTGSRHSIGVWPNGNGEFFQGLIDDVVIFDRALNAMEIAYIAGAALVCRTPIITRHPVAQTAVAGYLVEFTAAAVSDLPMSYQWQFKGVDLPGQTNAALRLNAMSLQHVGSYRVIISNSNGSIASIEAALNVTECRPAPSGLVGWWRAENNLLNEAGDTRGSVHASFGPGISGKAFQFDGIGDYVDAGSLADFDVTDFTVAAWVFIDPASNIGSQRVVSRDDYVDPVVTRQVYTLGSSSPSFPGHAAFGIGLGTGTASYAANARAPSPLAAGWRHLAGVRTGDTVSLYVDGTLVASNTADGPIGLLAPKVPLVFGQINPSYHLNNFKGAADDIMFFNRALNAAEVQVIYNNGSPSLCPVRGAPAVGLPISTPFANEGQAWTISAAYEGAGPFSFQWMKNGLPVPNATSSTLSISAIGPDAAADYFVVVKGPFGQRASEPFRLEVQSPPIITQQPSPQIVRTGPGNRVRLEVRAIGSAPFTYQWSKNTVEIQNATNALFEINSPSVGTAGTYRASVANSAGTVVSASALVQIIEPLRITRQPASVETAFDNPVNLSVEVAGQPPYDYQWRLNGWNIPSANSDTLQIPTMRLQDAGSYTVAITDAGGAVSSIAAQVTLTNIPLAAGSDMFANAQLLTTASGRIRADNLQASRETGEPEHAGKAGQHSIWFKWVAPAQGRLTLNTVGSSFDTLLGVYSGNTLQSLQELVSHDDSSSLPNNFATSEVLLNADAGQEIKIAIDGLGDSAGSIILSWDFVANQPLAPRIRVHPVSKVISLPAEVRLQVTSDNAQSYQWRLNEANLPGQTSAELVIQAQTRADLGVYDAVVTGGGVSVLSQPAIVQAGTLNDVFAFDKLFDRLFVIESAPSITKEKEKLIARAIGFGSAPAARGVFGSIRFHEASTIGGSREIGEPNHAGEAGGASTWFVIVPEASGWLEVTTAGSDFDTVLAVYSGEPNAIDYLDLELRTYDNDSGGGTASRVVLLVQAGLYYFCAVDGVKGAQGHVRFNYQLAVPPVILENPVPQNILLGAPLLLTARATNAAPANYQWRRNGELVPNAIGATLSISSATAAHAGEYTCVVTTFAGTAVSAPAKLTVRPAEPLRVTQTKTTANKIHFRIHGGSALPLRLQSTKDFRNWSETLIDSPMGSYLDFEAPAQETNPGLIYRLAQ